MHLHASSGVCPVNVGSRFESVTSTVLPKNMPQKRKCGLEARSVRIEEKRAPIQDLKGFWNEDLGVKVGTVLEIQNSQELCVICENRKANTINKKQKTYTMQYNVQ